MSRQPRLTATLAAAAPPAAAAAGVASALLWQVKGAVAIPALCALILFFSYPVLAVSTVSLLAAFDDYIGPAVVYRDFLVVDVVGFALIAGVVKRRLPFPSHAAGLTVGVAALTVFCALNILSLGPLNWTEALDNVARLLYFTALVAAIGVASCEVPLRPFLWLLVGSLVLRFLYEAWYYFGSSSFVLHFSYQFGAMTSNANTLAGLGACVLPMSCALMLRSSRPAQAAAVVTTMILAGGIFLSYSKGAWVTAAVSLGVWTMEAVRRRWIPARSLAALAAGILIVVALVPQVRRLPALALDRWVSQSSVISNRERLRYVATAMDFVQDHPIGGIGLERFGPAYLQARQLPRGPDDPHNGYLLVASELGIPALGCFVFVLLTALITAFRHSLKQRHEAPLRLGLAAAILGVLVFQMFSAEPLASRVCWVILALALTPVRRLPQTCAVPRPCGDLE